MTPDYTERWRLAAAEWLDLQDAADLLRETKNDVFAEIVARSLGSTNAEKERNARLNVEWQEFRTALVKAEAEARRAKFRVTYAKMKREDWLNGSANKRAEMRL